MNPKLKRALAIAAEAHAGQVRKRSNTPYIVHPFAVMMMLQYTGESVDVLCAAVLHDVLEDTDYTEAQMLEEMGDTITNAVMVVTKNPAIKDKKKQGEDYLMRLEYSESLIALGVAAADKCANLADTFDQGRTLSKYEEWWYNATLDVLKRTVPNYPLTRELERLIKLLEPIK